MSDCGDGVKEEEGRVDVWAKMDGIEHQWWNELVVAQTLVEALQKPQQQQHQ